MNLIRTQTFSQKASGTVDGLGLDRPFMSFRCEKWSGMRSSPHENAANRVARLGTAAAYHWAMFIYTYPHREEEALCGASRWCLPCHPPEPPLSIVMSAPLLRTGYHHFQPPRNWRYPS